MTDRPAPFRGIRHIAFVVTNLEECEQFYKDIMGMELLSRANENLVYLTCGNDNLSLARAASAVPSGGNMDHYGFIVETKQNLDDWHAFMKAKDVNVLDEPHDHADGARSFHCKDPAGNVIQPIYHPAISAQQFTT
ncbi:VOC family protein [Alphaproteobacteria bacterium]|jgi:catechol 2,3-dioxygenase-like lactoylglutathione lyase family enzyme|nr:VOC family protein [Alphaproteobacteria bacterium]|tara:strand:+ start:100 stop:507 length:408 start_codon:yes stop_codon:yes gene_type:complete